MVSFCEWLLPEIFRASMRALNRTTDDKAWLTTVNSMICVIKSCASLGLGVSRKR